MISVFFGGTFYDSAALINVSNFDFVSERVLRCVLGLFNRVNVCPFTIFIPTVSTSAVPHLTVIINSHDEVTVTFGIH